MLRRRGSDRRRARRARTAGTRGTRRRPVGSGVEPAIVRRARPRAPHSPRRDSVRRCPPPHRRTQCIAPAVDHPGASGGPAGRSHYALGGEWDSRHGCRPRGPGAPGEPSADDLGHGDRAEPVEWLRTDRAMPPRRRVGAQCDREARALARRARPSSWLEHGPLPRTKAAVVPDRDHVVRAVCAILRRLMPGAALPGHRDPGRRGHHRLGRPRCLRLRRAPTAGERARTRRLPVVAGRLPRHVHG